MNLRGRWGWYGACGRHHNGRLLDDGGWWRWGHGLRRDGYDDGLLLDGMRAVSSALVGWFLDDAATQEEATGEEGKEGFVVHGGSYAWVCSAGVIERVTLPPLISMGSPGICSKTSRLSARVSLRIQSA